jgi:hypothetical protein
MQNKRPWTDILRSIPTVLLFPLLVILGVLPFVAALLFIRRTLNRKALHHDVAGASFNVIGVLYTVLLAFVMVTDWERYRQTEEYCEWVIWLLLIVGGVLTLGYMNFFGIESFRVHVVMTVTLTAMLILILFIIYSLDKPFWGDPCISPEAFQKFLDAHPAP